MNDFELTDEMKMIELTIAGGGNVMITGGAGVGKSTFMRYLKESGHNFITLAPTGMVAMGGAVRGSTIHSFLKVPIGSALRNDHVTNFNIEYNLPVLKAASMVIIDEISMVRSDVFQTIDNTFKAFLKNDKPFGGKQMILVGDAYQLPPIVATLTDRRVLEDEYGSKYFFNTKAFKNGSFRVFELTKVFRQKDEKFVNILNSVRYGNVTEEQLEVLNSNKHTNKDNNDIIITTRNNIVDRYNEQEIDMLTTSEECFRATITGTINTKNVRAPENLRLKKGCKVMILINGMGYSNGTIGIYDGYDKLTDSLKVIKPDNSTLYVKKHEFVNVDYTYKKEERRVEEVVRGTMVQYPITLAYAISSHKSQGMTFDNVVFDIGSGAFDCGQVYVSLSRCTSLGGLKISSKLTKDDIWVDKEINKFTQQYVKSHVKKIS